MARRYDAALKPLGLTSGQFSLLMSLNQVEPPSLGSIAALLGMDRTTLTANLKPLAKRGFLTVAADAGDKRLRLLMLTAAGRRLLVRAVPIWRQIHADIESRLVASSAHGLRADLNALADV